MDNPGFLQHAVIYLAAALISVPVAKRLGLGSVLGYLAAGIAIGPFGLALVGHNTHDVMHFAEFGVVMMLFLIGLELQPAMLWRLRGPILGLGGLQVLVTAVVGAAAAVLLGVAWAAALAIGMILTKSSTAIVLQSLTERGLLRTDAGQRAFSVVIFQDIAVIPMLAVIPLLSPRGGGATTANHTWVSGQPGWVQTLVTLASVAAIVVVGRYGIGYLFRYIAKTHLREMFTVAALLLVVGIALLMTRVGLSPALGAFLAGVVLANSEYRHEMVSDIEPFKGLLLGLFFIAVGAAIDFGLLTANPERIVGLVAALVLGKLLLLYLLGRVFRMSLDQNLIFSFVLAQGGEFAFVLFSFAQQQGVLGRDTVSTLVAVVALSMAVTPLLLLLNEKLIQPRFGTREKVDRPADAIDEERPVIIAGFGRFGNIVGRLLRANNVRATVLDLDSDNVELSRKLGLNVFYGDASRLDLLHAAGAGQAKVLVVALDDPEKSRTLIRTVRKHFPHVEILARAQSVSDAHELLDEGVEHVYRETLDTSLRVGVDALRKLGFRAYQAERSRRIFRRHDEEAVRELAHHRHDQKAYLGRAKQRISDLEEIVEEEMTRGDDTRDVGWDVDSRREAARARAKASSPSEEPHAE